MASDAPAPLEARIVVGDPMRFAASESRWVCVAKIVAPIPWLGGDDEAPPTPTTETLLVRAGYGTTADEAREKALANVQHTFRKISPCPAAPTAPTVKKIDAEEAYARVPAAWWRRVWPWR